jgi:hypothetical protein
VVVTVVVAAEHQPRPPAGRVCLVVRKGASPPKKTS